MAPTWVISHVPIFHITQPFDSMIGIWSIESIYKNILATILGDVQYNPSGELSHSNGKSTHFLAGKIHYFDWAMFNCYVTNYQRVTPIKSHGKSH